MSLRIAAATAAFILATSTLALAAAPLKFNLYGQSGSNESAVVTMTETDGNTTVTVKTKNAPDLAQPVHIHKGTCAKLDEKPLYPLTTLQDGSSTTTLKGITIAQLEAGTYAVNIHHSTADIPTYYACGDIPKAPKM